MTRRLWVRRLCGALLAGCTPLQQGDLPRDVPMAARCDADLRSDDRHCGACGRACPGGQVCAEGVCEVELAPPRPRSPLTGTVTRARRPALRWARRGGDGARVELCRDRAMTAGCLRFDARGDDGAIAEDLLPGRWYWRLFAREGQRYGRVPSPTWTLHIGGVESEHGSILDLQGVGLPFFAVGAPRALSFTGRVYLYRDVRDPNHPTVQVLRGPRGRGEFGNVIASVGDLDGDGFADLAVGAPGIGQVLTYRGSAGDPAVAGPILEDPEGLTRFGYALAGVGDVNGDGFDDLAVGVIDSPDALGRAFVYHGAESGLATTPSVTLSGPRGGLFGRALCGADFNGDGFADLAVGANGVTGNAGAVMIFLGGAGGVAPDASRTLSGADAVGSFGLRLACGGDFNGDGYADLAVSAPDAMDRRGRVLVFHGSAEGIDPRAALTLTGGVVNLDLGMGLNASADIDVDGYRDLLIVDRGDPSAGSPGGLGVHRGGPDGVSSVALHRRLGRDGVDSSWGTATTLGDYDGDGRPDLVLSAVGVMSNTGRAYLFRGTADGFAELPISLVGPDGAQAVFGRGLASRILHGGRGARSRRASLR